MEGKVQDKNIPCNTVFEFCCGEATCQSKGDYSGPENCKFLCLLSFGSISFQDTLFRLLNRASRNIVPQLQLGQGRIKVLGYYRGGGRGASTVLKYLEILLVAYLRNK